MSDEYQDGQAEETPEYSEQQDTGVAVETEVQSETPSTEEASLDLTEVFNDDDSPQDSFRTQVEQLGVDINEGANANEALVDAYRQAQDYNQQWQDYHDYQQEQQYYQQQELAEQQAEMQEYANYGYDQYQQQQAQAYQAQEQEYERQMAEQQKADLEAGKWWNPPELEEEKVSQWRQQYYDPDTEEWYWDWKPETPAQLKQDAENYVKYHEKWQEDIATRPQEILPQIIEKEFDKLFIDRYGSMLEEFQGQNEARMVESQIDDINARNADWVYEHDPNTGQMYVDGYGQPVLTQQGERVVELVTNLRQSGLTDPNQLWDTASRLLAGEMAQGALQNQIQETQAARQVQQRNMRHLQRGAHHISNREGSVAPVESPSPISQNQGLSAGDKLRQQALADGLF